MNSEIDKKNISFWKNLCGTHLAKSLGIFDDSIESLKKFDDWYFDFYPYLFQHIPFEKVSGKNVLEVGLGYGSVSQRLAENECNYYGLDISDGPVDMVRHRLTQIRASGDIRQGSILAAPFRDDYFDYVVAIGCFHHTGNLRKAIDETYRILKPGGHATIMVYNAYSYRRFLKWPFITFKNLFNEIFSISIKSNPTDSERAAYDTNDDGNAAPETVFVSTSELYKMTAKWTSCEIKKENIDPVELPFINKVFDRDRLNKILGPVLGLDLYCRLVK